jgi:proline racemase
MDLHWRWPPRDAGALTIATIDAHAAGEPLRIIVDGMPPLKERRSSSGGATCASASTISARR